jgi:hypothetical protein
MSDSSSTYNLRPPRPSEISTLSSPRLRLKDTRRFLQVEEIDLTDWGRALQNEAEIAGSIGFRLTAIILYYNIPHLLLLHHLHHAVLYIMLTFLSPIGTS